jgi:hypothetical protein
VRGSRSAHSTLRWRASRKSPSRCRLATCRRQLLALGERVRDPSLLIEAQFALGGAQYFAGDFASARDHAEQGIHLYDPPIHRSHAFVYGQDPGVTCTSYAAWAFWQLGYADLSLARNEALALAHDVAHPYSLVWALLFAAALHQVRREPQLTEKRADAAIALSAERGFSFFSGYGSVFEDGP